MTPTLAHLTQQVAALEAEINMKNAALEDVLSPEEWNPTTPTPHPEPAGKKWMRKSAALVGAYINKDWDTCSRLCDEYATHNRVARIVASFFPK